MVENDAKFIEHLVQRGEICSPVLELGGGYGGETCREIMLRHGLEYFATDMAPAPGIDYVADFEDPNLETAFPRTDFGCVLVLNVLEHVFNPLQVLDNAVSLTRSGGRVVVITPCQWPVHNFPIDCQRLLPDWYVQYANRRENVELVDRHFEYLGFGPISKFADGKIYHMPRPTENRSYALYSRIIHRLFNTTGRGQWSANHIAVGAVFERL